MTSSHGRRIQSRRALAILTWVTLVVVAGLLWFGQQQRIIRVQAWEPASLLLSAYATFLSIFGWLLFSPGRNSAEESPGLFFSGMLTLLPPCFIAWHLMPVDSPLKPWLTIGVFLFGVLAIMSPLPEEVFAVPRHRRSYLQPLTNSYLSELDVSEPQVRFDHLAPQTAHWLSRPTKELENAGAGAAQDPWVDPFQGTGRQMSRIGVSKSRRSEETTGQERRRLADEQLPTDANLPLPDVPPVAATMAPLFPPRRILSEAVTKETDAQESGGKSRVSTTHTRPSNPLHSIDPNRFGPPTKITPLPSTTTTAAPGAALASRRPLSEPTQRSQSPVGFQTPVAQSQAISQVLPPLPESALPVAIVPARETSIPPKASLRELDRQLREIEDNDEEDLLDASTSAEDRPNTGALTPAPGLTRSVQQPSADVRLERIRDEHGGEMIEGTIEVFFEIGQKRAHLHVPFSPPLPGVPEVECEPVGEDSIRVRVAVRQPYGIRIEARRSEASEALKTEVSFAAVYTPSSRRG